MLKDQDNLKELPSDEFLADPADKEIIVAYLSAGESATPDQRTAACKAESRMFDLICREGYTRAKALGLNGGCGCYDCVDSEQAWPLLAQPRRIFSALIDMQCGTTSGLYPGCYNRWQSLPFWAEAVRSLAPASLAGDLAHLMDVFYRSRVEENAIDEEFLEPGFVGEKRQISPEAQALWQTVNNDLWDDDIYETDWLTPNLAHALRHEEWFFRKPSVAQADSRDTKPERTV